MSIYVEIYKFQLPKQTALVTGSAGGTEARLVNMEMIFLSPFATQAKGAAFSSLARRGSQSDSKKRVTVPCEYKSAHLWRLVPNETRV